jgi:hypothetical protein
MQLQLLTVSLSLSKYQNKYLQQDKLVDSQQIDNNFLKVRVHEKRSNDDDTSLRICKFWVKAFKYLLNL